MVYGQHTSLIHMEDEVLDYRSDFLVVVSQVVQNCQSNRSDSMYVTIHVDLIGASLSEPHT